MNVEKLIQAAEWCAKNDDCENCPATDECPFIGKGALQVIAIRDHVRAEVIAQVREWASKTSVEDMTTECCGRLLATLDDLAGEERHG